MSTHFVEIAESETQENPAYAGKSVASSVMSRQIQVQPRIRGESAVNIKVKRGEEGATPHTRGKGAGGRAG